MELQRVRRTQEIFGTVYSRGPLNLPSNIQEPKNQVIE